jgi:hypothetical protein
VNKNIESLCLTDAFETAKNAKHDTGSSVLRLGIFRSLFKMDLAEMNQQLKSLCNKKEQVLGRLLAFSK